MEAAALSGEERWQHRHGLGHGHDQIAGGVGGIIAAIAVLVGIDFEDVFGPVRIMLQ